MLRLLRGVRQQRRSVVNAIAAQPLSCSRWFSNSKQKNLRQQQQPFDVSDEQKQQFDRDGFLIVKNVLSSEQIEALRTHLHKIFDGNFETGVYPDEWYGRNGQSLPQATKEICNGWKADNTLASLVLSPGLGRVCSRLGTYTYR